MNSLKKSCKTEAGKWFMKQAEINRHQTGAKYSGWCFNISEDMERTWGYKNCSGQDVSGAIPNVKAILFAFSFCRFHVYVQVWQSTVEEQLNVSGCCNCNTEQKCVAETKLHLWLMYGLLRHLKALCKY